MNTQYDFSIGNVLEEGWGKVKGFKATAWGAVGIVVLISILLYVLSRIAMLVLFMVPKHTLQPLAKFIVQLLQYPLYAGLQMLGVKHVLGYPVEATMVTDYYKDILRIVGVMLASAFIALIPSFIGGILIGIAANGGISGLVQAILFLASIPFILLGLYLFVGYMFSLILVLDQNMSIFGAMKTSRKAVTQHWFKVFFTSTIMIIIVAISAIPLLIGLIWTVPWAYCVMGVLYKTIFSVQEAH